MGAVDLVLQVESPKSVTAGLQRIGRAGHNVGDTSKGRIFPKFRADLLECAVVAQRMREGKIETTVVPRNPLDVLAQQIVAMAASSRGRAARRRRAGGAARPHVHVRRAVPRPARERARHARRPLPERGVRRAAPAHRVGPRGGHDPRAQGRPRAGDHERRHDPRPRPVLRQPARTAAASASSTRRWSTRPAPARCSCSARRRWRIEEITRDRVIVSPAPGVPGAVPFWKGDGLGRPKELGEAIGAFARWAVDQEPATLERDYDLDRRAAAQPRRVPARAGGGHARACRRDRTVVIERFRDEIGDWRVCILSPVRRPRARRLGARAERPHPRAVRPRVGRDLVRRRDHRPPARRRRAAGRRARC